MCEKLNEILDGFYVNKYYVMALQYVKKQQEIGQDNTYMRYMNPMIDKLRYRDKKEKFDKLIDILIQSGYLGQHDTIKSLLHITDEGKAFLRNYSRFQMQGLSAKFTEVVKKNFSVWISIIALIVSVASFLNAPSELHQLIIPAEKYQKFTTPVGKMPDVVINAWQQIWKMSPNDLGGERAYIADFEVYDHRATDPANTSLDIYIGIK